MIFFSVYRSLSMKSMAISHGELGFTKGKYESVADIDDPGEILAGIAALLEPYAFSDGEPPREITEELLGALCDFQEAFDVDLREEIDAISFLCE